MIRFIPDTWRDAILRPLAMAAPDAGVYVEIMSPDFRYVFILALAAIWLVLAGLRRGRPATPVLLLLGLTTLAFVPWLVTSGNGRYFIAFLLAAGPLCLGLIYTLPFTRALRVTMAIFVVAIQAFVIHENKPWQWWGLARWTDSPFFETDPKSDLTSHAATYVTISSISYSLLAPRFPESSRWINLTSQKGYTSPARDAVRAQEFLAAAQTLKVIFPSMPDQMNPESLPSDGLFDAINGLLAAYRLRIRDAKQCGFLQSNGLASMASRRVDRPSARMVRETGFWICPLTRPGAAPPSSGAVVPHPADRVFEKLESLCPRLFRPGESLTLPIPKGALRSYIGSDMKAYVMADGGVYYKYLRALNAVEIGTSDAVMNEKFSMDCNSVRGRSGLPWEREI